CSLTVTPGAGNEFQLIGGSIIVGNGAANITDVIVDDGTNELYRLLFLNTSLAAFTRTSFPNVLTSAAGAGMQTSAYLPVVVSGTMRLRLQVSTATISLTHTFAVAVRVKGGLRSEERRVGKECRQGRAR